jgi:hypothetical protein
MLPSARLVLSVAVAAVALLAIPRPAANAAAAHHRIQLDAKLPGREP